MPADATTRLHAGEDSEALWNGVVLPWVLEVREGAWRAAKPVAVLAPSRNYAFFLKHRLLDAGIGFAGIRFWTPSDARAFLSARLENFPHTIEPHGLRLLFAAEAERLADNPTARAVARDPSGLVQALGRLSAAGWDWKSLGQRSLDPLTDAVARRLDAAGLATPEQADLRLAAEAAGIGRPIGALLVIGFDGAHWDAWQLLVAAARCSERAAICLLQPRFKSEEIDQAWFSSWEEFAGEAVATDTDVTPARPFAALAERMETQVQLGHAAAAGDVVFLMGYNVREEARAIATRAVAFLADPACTNMGILFPGYGALSREVAALLSEQGIALNDTLGYNAPASPEEQAWAAWLALQASPGLETFCRLVRTLPPPRGGVAALEEALDRAFNEVLVDDLGVLTAFMKSSSEKSLQAAASVMARFVLLPPRASLSEFLEATAGALDKLAWSERMADIRCVAAVLAPLVTDAFPRDAYLAWLGELTRFEAWQRDAERVHPFARVHLLTYTKADWQSWSHLILADLNENGWPPPCEDAPFLGERLVAHLNREALGEGSQGEGHVVARPGKSLILGPLQRRAVIQRQFFGLLESVRAGLCVAGAVTDESDPAHRRIPSDFLSHLYHAQTGRPLSDEMIDSLRDRTDAWVQASGLFTVAEETAPAEVRQTRKAFDARRAEGRSFGDYEFALARPPVAPITLPCRAWEQALKTPGLVWMKRVLGVEETGLDLANKYRMSLVLGTWVHRWLSSALSDVAGRFAATPDAVAIAARLASAAEATRAQAERAFAEGGRPIPEWWYAEWQNALRAAEAFAQAVAEVSDWPFVATEWDLPRGTEAAPAPGSKLRLVGRIDLLLAKQAGSESKGGEYWVVDYKTGRSQNPPKADTFAKYLPDGKAVQLALYGLALAAGGAGDVQLTLLTPATPLEPQLTGADVLARAKFWEGLCRMQDTGIFGMRGPVRAEFGASPTYPLATLEINADLLEAKWRLTHPLLTAATEGEEEE